MDAGRGAGPWTRYWLLLALAVLALVMLTARAAAAENLGPGGGSRLIVGDEIAGAYRLLATSSPEPRHDRHVTFVVRVTDPQTGAKVRDAQVEVALTERRRRTVLRQAATHQNAGQRDRLRGARPDGPGGDMERGAAGFAARWAPAR